MIYICRTRYKESFMDAINEGLGIAEKSIGLLDKILERTDKYKKIKQDTTTFLRLLYIEVLDNIEVLNTINFKQFNNIHPNHSHVQSLVNLLHTEIAEAIFYKEEENPNLNLYEKLKKQGQVKNREKKLVRTEHGIDKNVKGNYIYENILQAISFVVVKTRLIEKYSGLTDEELAILKPIKLDTRLINIYQRLLMIKNILDKLPEVQEMAR